MLLLAFPHFLLTSKEPIQLNCVLAIYLMLLQLAGGAVSIRGYAAGMMLQ